MFFTLKELVNWLRMTAFEIWLHIVSFLVFSVLAVVKHEGHMTISWWTAFIPLFACDALNAYFCVIVFVRQYVNADLKSAFSRFIPSAFVLTLIFSFKLLSCQKLSRETEMSMSQVMIPLFVLLLFFMVRACQTH